MNQNLPMNDPAEILASIREQLSDAHTTFETGGDAEWLIETAYLKMRVFLEAAGLLEALKSLQKIEEIAQRNWTETKVDPDDGEPYFVWGGKLYQYIRAIETVWGKPKAGIITKELVQILRAIQYSITDKGCFPHPPANENDVHVRVEAVLRCVFPDLLHKPSLAKQIKNFVPDTGLPSIQTLIEYKFISDEKEAKQVADEILADTRGYVSNEWKHFVYVIYETKRVKSEKQWRQLLEQSGVGSDTEIIVISGEEPTTQKKPAGSAQQTGS